MINRPHQALPDVSSFTSAHPAPAGSYTHVADDVNAQASNLHGWSQLYDQLSAGCFAGEIEGIRFDSMHLFRESTNLTLRQSCTVNVNGWWFGIAAPNVTPFRVDARPIAPDCVAVRPGYAPFELVTPPNFEIFGIVVSRSTLREHLRVTHRSDRSDLIRYPVHSEALQVNTSALAALQRLLREMLHVAAHSAEVMLAPASRAVMQNNVLDALASICHTSEACERIARSQVQHAAIVRNVRHYLIDHPDRIIAVPELCRVFDVSRRSLQYAFEQVLDISPNAYLRTLRLNGVRRALCDKTSAAISVQQTAADWGFWHLSQFAKDYRTLFNELPSATLKRRSVLPDEPATRGAVTS